MRHLEALTVILVFFTALLGFLSELQKNNFFQFKPVAEKREKNEESMAQKLPIFTQIFFQAYSQKVLENEKLRQAMYLYVFEAPSFLPSSVPSSVRHHETSVEKSQSENAQ